jgi:hypothetical protein
MYLVSLAIHFKHRDIFVSVDFIPWWVSPYTFSLQYEMCSIYISDDMILTGYTKQEAHGPHRSPE